MRVQLCGGPEDGKVFNIDLHPWQDEIHVPIYEPLMLTREPPNPIEPMSFKVGIYYRLSHPRNGMTLFMFDEDSI